MTERKSSLEELFSDPASGTAASTATAAAATRGAGDTGRPRRAKHRGLRNTLIVLGSLIALLAIAAAIVYAMLANSFNSIERLSIEQDPSLTRPAATTPAPGENAPVNILLLGSDSRDTSDKTQPVEEMQGFRSDSIMVAQISPDRKHMTVMSIMRDNWVEIQGHGEAKINAAVAFGGLPLAVNTIENFIGARIDHVALIDFESFKGLTDAVGGVTVQNDIEFTTTHGDHRIPAGEVTLQGDEALGFVRERFAFSDGDYQRARNQQAFLRGLTQQLLSGETLRDPAKLTSTFQAIKPYLVLDEQLDLATAVSLGYEMRDLRSGDIEFFTSPTNGTGTSGDGQSIVLPNWDEMTRVQAAFQNGTLSDYAATREPGSELP